MVKQVSATRDNFSLVHFLLWFLFGTLIPGQYFLAFILTIAFELAETFLVIQPTLYDFFSKYWIIPENYWNETLSNKILDVVLNMTGYVLGSWFINFRSGYTNNFYN